LRVLVWTAAGDACGLISHLPLKHHDDFVGGNGALAEYLPAAVAKGEVDDGGGQRAASGSAVDDERDAIADLVADACGMRAFRRALEIGSGSGDGKSEAFDNGTSDGRVRNAESDVAGVGGGAQGQLGACADDDGERPGPETVGELVEHGIGVASEFVRLGKRGNQKRKGLLLLAALDAVDIFDRVEIYWIDRETVEGVGGHGDDIALAQARNDVFDPVWLGLVGMDAQDFRGQEGLPRLRRAVQPRLNSALDCSPCWLEI